MAKSTNKTWLELTEQEAWGLKTLLQRVRLEDLEKFGLTPYIEHFNGIEKVIPDWGCCWGNQQDD